MSVTAHKRRRSVVTATLASADFLNEFFFGDFVMGRDVTEDSRQCSDFQRVVGGNRDVMLAIESCRESDMASALASDKISENAKFLREVRS